MAKFSDIKERQFFSTEGKVKLKHIFINYLNIRPYIKNRMIFSQKQIFKYHFFKVVTKYSYIF